MNIFEESEKVQPSHFSYLDCSDIKEVYNLSLNNLNLTQIRIIHASLKAFALNESNPHIERISAAKLIKLIEKNHFEDHKNSKQTSIIQISDRVFK